MKQSERLLHGPYVVPRFKRGDRQTCLYRDADVFITSWSSGRISWPLCRTVGSRGGGLGVWVNDELARAVRSESAAAIQYWWGVTGTTVCCWRKALGANILNNPGSQRAIRAAASRGAAAIKEREWSPADRAKRRLIAKRLKLGQYLSPGFNGFNVRRWTKKERALLSRLPVADVARSAHRSLGAVYTARVNFGVGKQRRKWAQQELKLVARLTPAEAAARTGRTLSAVYAARLKYGFAIPQFSH